MPGPLSDQTLDCHWISPKPRKRRPASCPAPLFMELFYFTLLSDLISALSPSEKWEWTPKLCSCLMSDLDSGFLSCLWFQYGEFCDPNINSHLKSCLIPWAKSKRHLAFFEKRLTFPQTVRRGLFNSSLFFSPKFNEIIQMWSKCSAGIMDVDEIWDFWSVLPWDRGNLSQTNLNDSLGFRTWSRIKDIPGRGANWAEPKTLNFEAEGQGNSEN